MSTPMNLSGPEAQRRADAIEAAASRDLYAAAPQALRTRTLELGGATVLIAPTLPVTYFNRVIGLGNEAPAAPGDLDRMSAAFRDAGVTAYWVHLTPSARPPDLAAQLERRGLALAQRRSWAKFLRDTESVPAPRTDLRVREAAPGDAAAVADVVCAAYAMPPSIGPWFGGLVGRPGWRVWVASEGDRIVGTGALFVHGDSGWIGVGATLAEFRGRGAQSALLVARIAAAGAAGCRVVATETGEPVDGEANPSLANIRRAGFVQVCSRLNYAAPAG